jgi:hypothetical protein
LLSPGFHLNVDPAAYFSDPCSQPSLTQSIAKLLINRSPAHARLAHPRLNPDYRADDGDYVRSLAIGNAAHRLVLGRGKEIAVIEANDFRSPGARQARAAVIAEGKVPILEKHHQAARELAAALRRQLGAMGDIGLDRAFREGCGDAEVVIAWEEDGIWFRSMIDWIDRSSPICTDLKTSGLSAAPHAVPPTMANAGWPIQAAFQERGLDIVDPKNAGRREFLFVMVENEEPYALSVHRMSEAVLTFGRRQVEHAARIWRQCMKSGDWPLYPPIVHTPEMPGYAETRWLNREIAEDEIQRERPKMLIDVMGG